MTVTEDYSRTCPAACIPELRNELFWVHKIRAQRVPHWNHRAIQHLGLCFCGEKAQALRREGIGTITRHRNNYPSLCLFSFLRFNWVRTLFLSKGDAIRTLPGKSLLLSVEILTLLLREIWILPWLVMSLKGVVVGSWSPLSVASASIRSVCQVSSLNVKTYPERKRNQETNRKMLRISPTSRL